MEDTVKTITRKRTKYNDPMWLMQGSAPRFYVFQSTVEQLPDELKSFFEEMPEFVKTTVDGMTVQTKLAGEWYELQKLQFRGSYWEKKNDEHDKEVVQILCDNPHDGVHFHLFATDGSILFAKMNQVKACPEEIQQLFLAAPMLVLAPICGEMIVKPRYDGKILSPAAISIREGTVVNEFLLRLNEYNRALALFERNKHWIVNEDDIAKHKAYHAKLLEIMEIADDPKPPPQTNRMIESGRLPRLSK